MPQPVFLAPPSDFDQHIAGFTSGIMAAGLAGGSEIFQFRWTSATKIAVIQDVSITASTDATGFTAGAVVIDMVRAITWSVDGSGGSTPTLTTPNTNASTADDATLLSSVRIANTAALVTGTKTLDSAPLAVITGGVEAGAGKWVSFPPRSIYSIGAATESGIVLLTNEGFVIRATVPATGTWKFSVGVKWLEQK